MKKLILLAFLILAQALPAFLKAELPDTQTTFSTITSGVKFYTLANGLRVIMYRRDVAPVFAGAIVVRVGGTDEPLGKTGISHLLEHMAFKGTADVGTSDYSKEKELLAELEVLAAQENEQGELKAEQKARRAQIGSELSKLWVTDQFSREYEKRGATGMNATTDKELTRYFVNLPRSAFEFWCYMESERILQPVFRQFYQEREVVQEERRMRYEDDPSGKLFELLLATTFRVHPYRNPTIGYSFDVKRLTASMVDDFHRKYYVPANMVVGLVGDIDAENDIKTVEKYFGRLSPGVTPPRPNAVEPAQEGERLIKLEERSSPEISIAYRKVQYPHPDDAPISVMLEILAGSKISPMYVELVKKRQIATSIHQEETPGFAYPNLMLFSATPRTPHTNEDVLKVFDSVVRKFKQTGVSAEELEMAKRSIAVESLAGFKSNMALALHFATSEAIYNDWKSAFDWYSKAMAVTQEDVKRVANQYLLEKARTIVELESTKVASSKAKSR